MYGEAEERQQLKSRALLLRHGHHPCPALCTTATTSPASPTKGLVRSGGCCVEVLIPLPRPIYAAEPTAAAVLVSAGSASSTVVF